MILVGISQTRAQIIWEKNNMNLLPEDMLVVRVQGWFLWLLGCFFTADFLTVGDWSVTVVESGLAPDAVNSALWMREVAISATVYIKKIVRGWHKIQLNSIYQDFFSPWSVEKIERKKNFYLKLNWNHQHDQHLKNASKHHNFLRIDILH